MSEMSKAEIFEGEVDNEVVSECKMVRHDKVRVVRYQTNSLAA